MFLFATLTPVGLHGGFGLGICQSKSTGLKSLLVFLNMLKTRSWLKKQYSHTVMFFSNAESSPYKPLLHSHSTLSTIPPKCNVFCFLTQKKHDIAYVSSKLVHVYCTLTFNTIFNQVRILIFLVTK